MLQVLRYIQPERPECRDKLDKIQQQAKWQGFPGVQALLLKGCTSPVTAEATWCLLSTLTLCISAPVIDPSQAIGKWSDILISSEVLVTTSRLSFSKLLVNIKNISKYKKILKLLRFVICSNYECNIKGNPNITVNGIKI